MLESQFLKIIQDLENQVKRQAMEFRRRFGHRKVSIVLVDVKSQGPITITFNKKHKGLLIMDITSKKGNFVQATFDGQDATGDVEQIQNLTATVSDTTNLQATVNGNTVTVELVGDTGISAAPATVIIGANDADGNALPPLTYTILVSDLATQLVNTSGWSTPTPINVSPAPASVGS